MKDQELENTEEQFCARCEGKGFVLNYDKLPQRLLLYIACPCPDCSGLGVKNTRTKQTNQSE